jgi:hypothetical protein
LLRAMRPSSKTRTRTGTRTDGPMPARRTSEATGPLNLEITTRLATLPALLKRVFSFTQFKTFEEALTGQPQTREGVGRLGNYRPAFSQFNGQSLLELLWRLGQSAPELIADVRKTMERLRRGSEWLDSMILVKPVSDDDSQWRLSPTAKKDVSALLGAKETRRWM